MALLLPRGSPLCRQACSPSNATKQGAVLLFTAGHRPSVPLRVRPAWRSQPGGLFITPRPTETPCVCRVRGLGQEESFSTHQTQQIALLAIVPVFLMTLKWAASTGPAALAIPAALLAVPIAGGGLRQLVAEGFSMAFSWSTWLHNHQKHHEAGARASPAHPHNRHMHSTHNMQGAPAHHQHWAPSSPPDMSNMREPMSDSQPSAYNNNNNNNNNAWPAQAIHADQHMGYNAHDSMRAHTAPMDRTQHMRRRRSHGQADPRTRAGPGVPRHESSPSGSYDDLDWPAEDPGTPAAHQEGPPAHSSRAYAYPAWSTDNNVVLHAYPSHERPMQPGARQGSVSRDEGERLPHSPGRGRPGNSNATRQGRWLN